MDWTYMVQLKLTHTHGSEKNPPTGKIPLGRLRIRICGKKKYGNFRKRVRLEKTNN